MDSTLTWKPHIDETERKVSTTITAMSTLGNSAWGVGTNDMRKIYNGVAVPQMMYACSAWSNAGWGRKAYTKRTLQRLERLQARAARVMSGAFKATSFPALDVEMHLLPVEQQIWRHNLVTIGRIGSRDGSGINGRIGAAAVCTTTSETTSVDMGADTTSTVYAGELQGIILALWMALADRAKGNIRSKILIYTDNQAAIRSSAKPKGKSGACLLKDIAQRIQELNSQGLSTEIWWISVYTGIQGNEDADRPWELYSLQSTLKTWTHKEASKAWQRKWTSETRGRTSFRYTPKPTKKILQLHEGLIKRQSAILLQMRTEKIGLRKFLFSRRVPDITDDACPCREGRQTVSHVLLRRRRFRQLRRQELGSIPGRNDLRALLNKRTAAAKAIRFMEQTEILGQFRIEPQARQS
ncbi:conserved hypothetical protein [Verticillium alfalfae VaMs.102]|uniref:Uncharacterized protein n=1 Tax=Verticillium alfalfae (strain VaMs.102 / ATCC MYA-4576 / FGSC 10136) TaxID=526221 RepID=C9SY72_VERA1|nr:conserved hypothetical protein [Verticillium alfalfae VaMs.102]EEY23737.1 conserved hypothetical protein [Verticillium alfalfae VaMs.102]